MSRIFRPRRGQKTTMQTDKSNLVLADGEMFVEFAGDVGDSKAKVKFGDGVSTYANLPYAISGSDDNFVGTLAEWNALTASEKAAYKTADITNDYSGFGIDNVPTSGSTNLLSSGAVYTAINAVSQSVNTLNQSVNTFLTGTLEAGETTLTFTNAAITANSILVPYVSVYGVSPTDITATAGEAVLTFDEQEVDVSVKLWVR